MERIFIIEDDKKIIDQLKNKLEKWEFEVASVHNWNCLINEIQAFRPNLITMDITLPRYDGFYWTNEIRKNFSMPIIFLTAADININGVRALTNGANDYIEKPFAIDYLVAKINLLLHQKNNEKLEIGNAKLNSMNCSLIIKDRSIHLTMTETIIVKILMAEYPQIISKSEIINQLWDNEKYVNQNVLEVNISRLRSKLSQIDNSQHIITVRNKGYQWKK